MRWVLRLDLPGPLGPFRSASSRYPFLSSLLVLETVVIYWSNYWKVPRTIPEVILNNLTDQNVFLIRSHKATLPECIGWRKKNPMWRTRKEGEILLFSTCFDRLYLFASKRWQSINPSLVFPIRKGLHANVPSFCIISIFYWFPIIIKRQLLHKQMKIKNMNNCHCYLNICKDGALLHNYKDLRHVCNIYCCMPGRGLQWNPPPADPHANAHRKKFSP